MDEFVKISEVEKKIITIRGVKVILDREVAELYGVETMRINEAVKNNPSKFPKGYVFELSKIEKEEVIENFDILNKVKYYKNLPKAFTERGLYMLATILKSKKAVQTTIAIVETFTQFRELSRSVAEMSTTVDENHKTDLMQKSGEIISELIGNELNATDTETSLEINLAILKFKHTIKRKLNQ